jgi:hypothetical protein
VKILSDAAQLGSQRPTPDGTPVDRSHPAWCSPRVCGVDRPYGEHRSEPVPVERVENYDTRTVVWLSQFVFEPPRTAEVWVHVRTETLGSDGHVDQMHTEDFRLTQAERLGSVLTPIFTQKIGPQFQVHSPRVG